MHIKINDYDAVDLQEGKGKYAGTFSLVLGYEDAAGNFKPKFCKREFGKDNEKTVPVMVPVGDMQTRKLIAELLNTEIL
jgi:hypothetical protein